MIQGPDTYSMETIELTIRIEEVLQERLVAELDGLGFSGYVQDTDTLKAYGTPGCWTSAHRTSITNWFKAEGIDPQFALQHIAPQNWNAQWEASIQPVVAGPFLIKPTWAETPAAHTALEQILIDPKMSFGTGQHESTRLILTLLPKWIKAGDRVLDAGTGTGVLGIAALRLGATSVIGFDVDPWAQENANENIQLNGASGQMTVRTGTIETIPETGFDLILANINRNILLDLLPDFARRLTPGGRLMLAGLLHTDADLMLEAARTHGFHMQDQAGEGEWWSVVFTM